MRTCTKLLLALSCLLCGLVAARAADPSWTGTWDTRWRDGGARLELSQDGDKVSGIYPAYSGRVEGTVEGRALTGTWTEGARSGGLHFVMAPDGQSFMGRFANGEWWTGGRVAAASVSTGVDQSTPRATMTAFVDAANAARNGQPDALAAAGRLMDFGADGGGLLPGQRIEAAKQVFSLLDQTTFHLWAISGERSQASPLEVTLAQAGSGATFSIAMTRRDNKWFIVNPSAATLDGARAVLLARTGGKAPALDDFKLRKSPRDALRTFLSGFADWNGSGRAEALSALDLSDFAPAVREYEGELAAQYLKQILDRVGSDVPQEVPDDPASRDPYVLFSHPAGSVVIAPVGTGDALSWKITSDSVRSARTLYVAVEDLPVLRAGAETTPTTAYFRLRQWIRDRAPALLNTVGELEIWQALAWAGVLLVSIVLAIVLTKLIIPLLHRLAGSRSFEAVHELRWPIVMALTFSIYKLMIPAVGLPELSKQISVGTTGVLLAIALMWLGWRVADLIVDLLFKRDARAVTMDNIVVSLAFGAIKLAILAAGFVFIAIELSLPYEGVIAGLSIGGLAVAFASRETLSNVFGAAVLAIDRPFRRGDFIVAGDTQGTVESVGIRSTRIRTADDSLVVVPNGKLSDATVNNRGTRRFHVTTAEVPVAYGATADQLLAFADGIEGLIAKLPEAVPERTSVNVSAFEKDSIEVEYTVCLDGRRVKSEKKLLSNLALDIMRLGESVGVRLGKPA